VINADGCLRSAVSSLCLDADRRDAAILGWT